MKEPTEYQKEIWGLYLNGHTAPAIARARNVGKQAIYNILRKHPDYREVRDEHDRMIALIVRSKQMVICPGCGEAFHRPRRKQRTCSHACARKAAR